MSLDHLFTLLNDESWHSSAELSKQLGIKISKVTELSKLLSSHGIIQYNKKDGRVKIKHLWRLLLPIEEASTETETFTIPSTHQPQGEVNTS